MCALKKDLVVGTAKHAGDEARGVTVSVKEKFAGLTEEQLVATYRMMLMSRRMDEKMLILLKQGKLFFHIGGPGHEAIEKLPLL